MATDKLIWTQKAVTMWGCGKDDPRHTISAPNVAEVYDGFVRQFRAGTPWILVAANGSLLDSGQA